MTDSNSLAKSWNAGPVGRIAAPLREQVIAALRQAIVDFQLKPGQRLIERELIEQLGVSRTTVREALRELTSEGLVTVVPQRGAVVSSPSLDDAVDLYEVRASLESLIVRHFVQRASDQEVAQLKATVDDLDATVQASADVRRILGAKDRFYAVLLEGARSPVLRTLQESIQNRVQILRSSSLSKSGRPKAMVRELRAIARAIAKRDADLAAQLCTEHVRTAARTALADLTAAGASRD
ncbi:GntR family transcriptional regulator [Zavarzinia compransoris]|uniref:GntR family transcriptional regulator n=1 Tax=Zavarzinia compransoris TaxID=1264899 RepID=A0A317E5M1_9PROT|nr:GntR family transcriptional regulator [Zavarzinia compransoris]PWR21654.1 GntR family transcriptional regulator [Zavarzinia compransoris]TDP45565.1 GntR family transcriptional regulator [Zavarzinia compransoris]